MTISSSFIKKSIAHRTFTNGDFNTLSKHLGLLEEMLNELYVESSTEEFTQTIGYVLNKIGDQLDNQYWVGEEIIDALGLMFHKFISKTPDLNWMSLFSDFSLKNIVQVVVMHDVMYDHKLNLSNYSSYRALEGLFAVVRKDSSFSKDILYQISDSLMDLKEQDPTVYVNDYIFSSFIYNYIIDMYLDKWSTTSLFKQAYFVQLMDSLVLHEMRFNAKNTQLSNVDHLINYIGSVVPHEFIRQFVSYKEVFDIKQPTIALVSDMLLAYLHKDEHVSCDLPSFN